MQIFLNKDKRSVDQYHQLLLVLPLLLQTEIRRALKNIPAYCGGQALKPGWVPKLTQLRKCVANKFFFDLFLKLKMVPSISLSERCILVTVFFFTLSRQSLRFEMEFYFTCAYVRAPKNVKVQFPPCPRLMLQVRAYDCTLECIDGGSEWEAT